MVEIIAKQGVGPLKLGMSPKDVAALIGLPKTAEDPSEDEILDDDDMPFYKNQIIEMRGKVPGLDLIDLLYEKNKLVCISLCGDSKDVEIAGMAINGNRVALLEHVRRLDDDVYARRENFLFLKTGICISAPGNRKDMNYVRLFDVAFKKKRLAYELYKKHSGKFA